MGITDKDKFSERQNNLARYAKSLGHPARIAIIEHLISSNNCICGDIVEEIPLSQSTISQHLKELKEAGIIKVNKQKTSSCYCLDLFVCRELKDIFHELFEEIKNCNCC